MTQKELFEEVFGENIFTGRRTQERTDRRTGAYAFMKRKMGMTTNEIALETGKNHATVSSGIKRFEGLLESKDKIAIEIWLYITYRVKAILAYTDGEILTIEGEVEEVYTKKKIKA